MLPDYKKNIPIDWSFILFLIGSVYVKLYIKVAVALLYLLYVLINKYSLPRLNKMNRFYVFIIVAGILSSFINGSFAYKNYWFGCSLGVMQWIVAGLISYLSYVYVINSNAARIEQVMKIFFAINIAISLGNLFILSVEAKSIFPYWLLGTEKYGASTGDYIKGVFGSSSVINASICSIGSLYFLFQNNLRWALVCMMCMLLCTSNVTLIFYTVVLLSILFTAYPNNIKKNVLYILVLLLFSYPILSPQNLQYAEVVYARSNEGDGNIGKQEAVVYERAKIADSSFSTDAIAINNNGDEYKLNGLDDIIASRQLYLYADIKDNPLFSKRAFYSGIDRYRMPLKKSNRVIISAETKALKRLSEKSIKEHKTSILDPMLVKQSADRWYETPMDKSYLSTYYKPVKLYSMLQTAYYLISNPKAFLLGAGIGNFSSKLAIKTSGIGIQGAYPEKYNYISQPFAQYHFYTLIYVLGLHPSEHSIINTPYSGLNNIAGEYGIFGLLLFVVFYVGFVWSNRKHARVLPYILLLFLMFWGVEYWFELISLTVIFELMVFEKIYSRQHE